MRFRAFVLVLALFWPVFADSADAGRLRVGEFVVEGQPEGLAVPGDIIPSASILYDTGTVKRAARAVSRFLAESGYPYNKITTSVIPQGDSIVTVRFQIDADERVCNGPAVVTGVGKGVGMYLRDVRLIPGRLYNAADVDETVRSEERRVGKECYCVC
jgi:hypothetical protein